MHDKFITVEGLDGSGKTIIVNKIMTYFNNRGIFNIISIREPGGTPISDILCQFIKYGSVYESINNISELLMIYAARSQLLENIVKPALSKGYWVISDRYDLSSYAYQGGGRGIDSVLLDNLSKAVVKNLNPNLIFYLDISPEIGLLRIKNHRKKQLDRIESESLNFFYRVRSCYLKLASIRNNVVVIDANRTLEQVLTSIYKYLDKWLFNFKK